jgi:hypothetical protein
MPPLPNYFEFGVNKPNVTLSTHAIDYDAVLKSDKNMILQSGSGASALYIQRNTNNVGLGISNPSEVLDVVGFSHTSLGYKTGTVATAVIDSNANIVAKNTTLTGNLIVNTDAIYVDLSNNNIGIGTNTPSTNYKLHVRGRTRIEGDLEVNGTTTVVNTNVVDRTTEQLNITNDGTGPAVTITQTGAEDIFKVLDDANTCFLITDNGHLLVGGVAASTYQLDVSGNSHFINNVDISQNLNVSGNGVIAGTLSCTGLQINGNLGVSGDFDLSQNFRILTDKFTVDPLGNTHVAGTLDVTGNSLLHGTFDVCGNTLLEGRLDVNGASVLKNTVDICGNAILHSTLDVCGNSLLEGRLDVNGASVLKSTVDICGNAVLYGTLDVCGNSLLEGRLDVNGASVLKNTVDICGNAVLHSNFDVCGNSILEGTLNVNGNTLLRSAFDVCGNSILEGTVEVLGNTLLRSAFDVCGNSLLEGRLDVNGATVLKNTVDICGNAVLYSNFDVCGNSILEGTLNVNGNTLLRSAFDVCGNSLLEGTLNVNGATVLKSTVDICGNTTVGGNLAVATNKLFVDIANSKVGINNATPAFQLDVDGSIANNTAIIYSDENNNGLFAHRTKNNATEFAMLQTSNGQTRINCKDGAGNIIFTHGGADIKQEFDKDGNVIIQGNLFSYSDSRIKTNVETIKNALDKLISLRGVTYNMIKDVEIDPEAAPKHLGLIAQEVESVIPEVVKEENGIKTVAYGNIVGLIIQAIKELREEIRK